MHMQVKPVRRSGFAITPRQTFFRAVRTVLALSLMAGLGYAGWRALTIVETDQAYLNAEIVSVQAPIAGELHLSKLQPGAAVTSGTPLFRIENPRFAATPIATELTRVQELLERLRVESAEADAQLPKLEEIFKHAAALNREKLMSPMQFMQEDAKLALARKSAELKREQLALSQAKLATLESQATGLKEATVTSAFDGVVWAAPMHDGALAEGHETILQVIDPKRVWVEAFLPERHATKFHVGAIVTVRLLDDERVFRGCVESVRAGVGRIPVGNTPAVAPGEFTQRRIAVRIGLISENPLTASEFYGVGRSVTVDIE